MDSQLWTILVGIGGALTTVIGVLWKSDRDTVKGLRATIDDLKKEVLSKENKIDDLNNLLLTYHKEDKKEAYDTINTNSQIINKNADVMVEVTKAFKKGFENAS